MASGNHLLDVLYIFHDQEPRIMARQTEIAEMIKIVSSALIYISILLKDRAEDRRKTDHSPPKDA
jgi:hypothetical protein